MLGGGAGTREALGNKAVLEEQIPVHEESISICGAATQVLKCGPWKNLQENANVPRLLFLVIPGNPGLAGYYRTFIQALYCCLNRQYPVWVVSHAGHCKVPHDMDIVEALWTYPCAPMKVFKMARKKEAYQHSVMFLKNQPSIHAE